MWSVRIGLTLLGCILAAGASGQGYESAGGCSVKVMAEHIAAGKAAHAQAAASPASPAKATPPDAGKHSADPTRNRIRQTLGAQCAWTVMAPSCGFPKAFNLLYEGQTVAAVEKKCGR